MGRSVKKGPFVPEKLLKRVIQQKQMNEREPIRTWARATMIVPDFVSHTFLVHNGKMFHKVFGSEDMVGHRLGEFSPTRSFRGHSSRK